MNCHECGAPMGETKTETCRTCPIYHLLLQSKIHVWRQQTAGRHEQDRADAEALLPRIEAEIARGPRVRIYLTMVRGLFAMRKTGIVSQDLEGEIAGIHEDAWNLMSEDERAEVEIGIEKIKAGQ